jgi:phospholipid/cholesterol/gamma-HCH transport system substrate-binding protein
MKRILATAAVLVVAGAFLVLTLGSSSGGGAPTYKIELDNAFGLVNGADFKVAGVIAGSIKSIDLDQKTLHAVVTVQVRQRGFGAFHSDVFCQSRPQSLIGEYFLDCDPGTQGKVLPPGSTIPVTHTQSTIPADLVQNVMRLPYRERFSLIINELGAAVASRSEDLQTALHRADPALAETDNLLALLANDAQTIRDLNANANTVITALANNSRQVQRFVTYANNAATDSATQAPSIEATWNKLPAFLEQLRPALAKLGAAADAQDPVFTNLNAAATNLNTFFHELVPFSHESVPSLQSLGNASAVGKPAVQNAAPAVSNLNQFAKPTPELAQNLAIVLQALDAHQRTASAGGPIEPDPRSPGGTGYSGLEGLLQYVFNITNAISYYGSYGHLLGVDAFANQTCSPYATPQTIANNIASYVKAGGDLNQLGTNGNTNPRSCYAFLGPNQPGVNEPDPSWKAPGTAANPSACVPDPSGYPVQGYGVTYYGPQTSVCKLPAQSSGPPQQSSTKHKRRRRAGVVTAALGALTGAGGGSSGSGSGGSGGPLNLNQTLGQILSQLTGVTPPVSTPSVGGATTTTTTPSGGGGGTGSQAQQLLNYLLSP